MNPKVIENIAKAAFALLVIIIGKKTKNNIGK